MGTEGKAGSKLLFLFTSMILGEFPEFWEEWVGPVRGWKRAIPSRRREGRSPRNLPACLSLGVHFSARVWSLSIPLPHMETGWLPSSSQ